MNDLVTALGKSQNSRKSSNADEGIVVAALKKFPPMSEEQFAKWSELLVQKTGMHLPDKRMSFLVTNLGIRMRALGFDDYEKYYDHLLSGRAGAIEWDKLVHYLTVHETRFLRNEYTLALIREHYLPKAKSKCAGRDNKQPSSIHIWSVGCSTGEEPYSVAMAIDDHMTRLGCEFYMGVIASDISRSALSFGRAGIYTREQIKYIEPEWKRRYFNVLPDGRYQVNEDLRQRVCFNHLNVLNLESAPIGAMDIIVCQNLLIYYQREQREKIVSQLVERLTPGGLLILGVGELINWNHPDVEKVNYANTLAFRHH